MMGNKSGGELERSGVACCRGDDLNGMESGRMEYNPCLQGKGLEWSGNGCCREGIRMECVAGGWLSPQNSVTSLYALLYLVIL